MSAQNSIQHQEFLYDFAVLGGAQGNIALGSLPKGAVVTDAHVTVETIVTSAGAPGLKFGNVTTPDQYIASKAKTTVDTLGKVVGGSANTLAQNTVANDSLVIMRIETADLTAGKLRMSVRYFIPSSSPLTSN